MARYPRHVYAGIPRWVNLRFEPKGTTLTELVAELREFADRLESEEDAPIGATVSLGEEIECGRDHDYSDYYYGSDPQGNNALAIYAHWADEPTEEQVELAKKAVDDQRAAQRIARAKRKKAADAKREKELRDLVKKNRAALEKLLKETE